MGPISAHRSLAWGVAGGIWNQGGTLNVANSTISGNISNTNEAGGIWNNVRRRGQCAKRFALLAPGQFTDVVVAG